MKTSIKVFALVSFALLGYSFTPKETVNFIGTYGVSEQDPSQIRLTLKADNTFTYQDFSATDKKIAVNGTWQLKGNRVKLNSNTNDIRFHDTWTFVNYGNVTKSHKGLLFYRLCKISD